MAYTEEMRALDQVRALYGKTGFTEDHVDYRRVGCRIGLKKYSAIGQTWDEALENLKAKVEGSHA